MMMLITANRFKTELMKLVYNLIKLSYDPRPGWRHRFVHSQKHVPGRLGRPQGVRSGPAGWMDCHDLQKCRLPGIEQFMVLYIYAKFLPLWALFRKVFFRKIYY